MFGEMTGPIDNIASDAPLGGNRKCTEQGVPAQREGCSSVIRLAVRNEVNLVGRHARPTSKCLLSQRNKAPFDFAPAKARQQGRAVFCFTQTSRWIREKRSVIIVTTKVTFANRKGREATQFQHRCNKIYCFARTPLLHVGHLRTTNAICFGGLLER
jgi:hypothetical protein